MLNVFPEMVKAASINGVLRRLVARDAGLGRYDLTGLRNTQRNRGRGEKEIPMLKAQEVIERGAIALKYHPIFHVV